MKPRLFKPLFLSLLAIAAAGGGGSSAAIAADWQLVLSDRGRRVEIDRASIFDSDRGTKVSWGRVVLSPDEARQAGYAAVKALNRYDCMNRSFQTVKRVYLDAMGEAIREEAVSDAAPAMVARNSVDERMWREVCRPPSVAEVRKVADAAGRSVAALAPQPAVALGATAANPIAPRPPQAAVGAAAATPGTRAITEAAAPMPRQQPVAATAAPTPKSALPTAAAVVPPRPAAQPPGLPARASSSSPQALRSAPFAPAWGYEGVIGPARWGSLRPEWKLCDDGRRQSPIDLRDGVAVDLDPVAFDYRPIRFRIVDTGNTLQVEIGEKQGEAQGGGLAMTVRGARYVLERLTLHRPSEMRVEGKAYDMAVHFHHRAEDGREAILAVHFERGETPNAALQTLWNNLPLEKGAHYTPQALLDPGAFLPAVRAHYLYMGSATTPPCTEGVLWVVMKAPVPVSAEQEAILARLYPSSARPVQATHDRLILESR